MNFHVPPRAKPTSARLPLHGLGPRFLATHVHVRYMSSSVHLSSVVCLSSVTFVHPIQAIEIFGNVSTPCGTLAILDLCIKILRRSSQGNPFVGGRGLNLRGVAKYSDFRPFEGYISKTMQDMI